MLCDNKLNAAGEALPHTLILFISCPCFWISLFQVQWVGLLLAFLTCVSLSVLLWIILTFASQPSCWNSPRLSLILSAHRFFFLAFLSVDGPDAGKTGGDEKKNQCCVLLKHYRKKGLVLLIWWKFIFLLDLFLQGFLLSCLVCVFLFHFFPFRTPTVNVLLLFEMNSFLFCNPQLSVFEVLPRQDPNSASSRLSMWHGRYSQNRKSVDIKVCPRYIKNQIHK